jgi:hypothetical protein
MVVREPVPVGQVPAQGPERVPVALAREPGPAARALGRGQALGGPAWAPALAPAVQVRVREQGLEQGLAREPAWAAEAAQARAPVAWRQPFAWAPL